MSVILVSTVSAQLMPPHEGEVVVLDRTVVPADAKSEVLLEVRRFGRFAVVATSQSGVSLQLVDRMKGPGEVRGQAGEKDGRLDVFLDRGEYKIIVRGHKKAEGDAVLKARAFTELSASPAPQLVDLKLIGSQLLDFEQRSY